MSLAGGIGLVGLGAAVITINDDSSQLARVRDDTIILNAASLSVNATANRNIEVSTNQGTSGLGAIGASFTQLRISGDTQASIGTGPRGRPARRRLAKGSGVAGPFQFDLGRLFRRVRSHAFRAGTRRPRS